MRKKTTEQKTIYKIEDVSIIDDRHAKDIKDISSGIIALDFKSEADCHTVAKMVDLEHYNVLVNTVTEDEDGEFWFDSRKATYVYKDKAVTKVENKRKARKRSEAIRKQNITKTILALPQTKPVHESEHFKVVAEKREIKTENGIWEKYSSGRCIPAGIYNFVIYVKPTHFKGKDDDERWYDDEKKMVKNTDGTFIKSSGRWGSNHFDSYVVKCRSWSSPCRKDYYQLRKKAFAEDIWTNILKKKSEKTEKRIALIKHEALEFAVKARDIRNTIIEECDEMQKDWHSDSDVSDF